MDEKFSASPVYQWTIEKGIAIGEANRGQTGPNSECRRSTGVSALPPSSVRK